MFNILLIVVCILICMPKILTQTCSDRVTSIERILQRLGPTQHSCTKPEISEEEMKRRRDVCEKQQLTKPTGNWSLGLIDSIKDPNLIVLKSDNIVVIKDKFPKAKFHYLIIPDMDISNIFKLNASHVKLLESFGEILEKIEREHCGVKLRAGFHAVPSMQRLHMHVISEDMVSPCLKTKVHWNSFTTAFFIPFKDLLEELREQGNITRISEEEHKALLAAPLVCNRCDFTSKNMPQLKQHLLTHL